MQQMEKQIRARVSMPQPDRPGDDIQIQATQCTSRNPTPQAYKPSTSNPRGRSAAAIVNKPASKTVPTPFSLRIRTLITANHPAGSSRKSRIPTRSSLPELSIDKRLLPRFRLDVMAAREEAPQLEKTGGADPQSRGAADDRSCVGI